MPMAKTDFKSVDEYIATHPEHVQTILQRVRSTIRKAVPEPRKRSATKITTYNWTVRTCLFRGGGAYSL